MTIPSPTSSIALITGGSRGLGRAMALALADHGIDSIITFVSQEGEAQKVLAEVAKKGRHARALRLDVGDVASFEAFAQALKATLKEGWNRPTFDALINNAGFGGYAPIATVSERDFDSLCNVHLKGPLFLTQKLLPVLADGGRIINISTGLTRFAYPNYGAYAAMKGGLEVLTRYMATELGGRGIAVNSVAPGAIETDFGGGAVKNNPELKNMIASQTALGRVGVAEDIGGVVAALLSPGCRWVNGQRIEVAGGIHI